MDLKNQLSTDMKSALKSGDKQRLSVIRMLLSDVRSAEFAAQPTTAEQAVAAYRKRLQKSADEYEKLGRTEQVQQLQAEMAVVDEYLPRKASAEETGRLIDAFVASNAFTARQFGQAMGAFMKQHGQDVDPAVVSSLLRGKLPSE